MNIYIILTISFVIFFILMLILIIRNRTEAKHSIGFKDRSVLDAIIDESSNKGMNTEETISGTKAESIHNNNPVAFKSKEKVQLEDNTLAEDIAINVISSVKKESEKDCAPSLPRNDQPDVSAPKTSSKISTEVDTQSYELGLLLLEKKKFNEAIDYFTKAIELNPADGTPYYYRGEAKKNLNLLSEAIEDYTDAMLQKLNMVDVFYKRGYCKFKLDDKSGALKDFSSYVSIDKHNPEIYYYKGLLEYEAGNYSEALEDLDRAIELNPNHESAYFKRGMAKEKTGDKKGCYSDLKTAFDKGNLEAYHYLKKFRI